MLRNKLLCAWTLLTLAAGADAQSFARLFAKVDPAVVVLHTVERQVAPSKRSGEVALPSLGSGVLIDNEGHVITAAHVVQTADHIAVEFAYGARVTAAVVASDPMVDLALLKLDELPSGVAPAKLGDSDTVNVGDQIFVVGAPYGLGHTLTVGHISGRHERGTSGLAGAEVLQTDAAINQGNSGGPMFNLDGEVIGIVSYILSQSGGFEGLGFAVTAKTVRSTLFEHRMFWSGMTGLLLTDELAKALNVPQPMGYLVQKVAHNSPAENLGLKPGRMPAVIGKTEIVIGGDIILAVDGIEISAKNSTAIREKMQDRKKGDYYKVRVLRAGVVKELGGVVP